MHAGSRLHPSSFVPPSSLRQYSEPPPPLLASFTGPFQIIEPGSDQYVETEPNFSLDLLLADDGLDANGGLFLSENGIPAEVLEDAFRLDDECGGRLPGPVPEGVTVEQYEVQLVAEMERLFPELEPGKVVGKRSGGGIGARLAEEVARKMQTAPVVVSNSPCYMNVFLKGGFLQGNVAKSELPAPTERGYRCVEMIDGTGTMFKAKYYADQMLTTTPARPSTPVPRAVSFTPQQTPTPTRLPKLKNMTPAMANKIESLASGLNRNVTLTPVRHRNSLLSTPSTSSSSSSTIVIKAPKRTVASGSAGPTILPDPFFPMPMIKQEPPDEFSQEQDPLNIPAVQAPKPIATSKQPRKQKLIKLSQNGEVVFNDTSGGGAGRRQVRAPVPPHQKQQQVNINAGDKIRSSGGDISEPKKQHPQLRTSTPNRPPKASRSSLRSLPPSLTTPQNNTGKPGTPPVPPPKRTRYRVHMTQTQLPQQQHRPGVSKRVPVPQTIESIEILDSSDDNGDDEEETTTAPESSEPESDNVIVVASSTLPKLPGNTESIQCPYCCRIFRTSQAVLEHAKTCADASLFRQVSGKPPQQQQRQSLLKGSFPSTIATRRRTLEPTVAPKPPKTTPMISKRSERLSIEILPSAFNIDNLLLCQACQKSFRTVEHLQQHQRIHQAPVVCEFCKKKFYETLPPKHVCQEKKRSM